MGLGKTIETIDAINQLRLTPTLIISPAVMRRTWAKELNTWLNLPRTSIYILEGGKYALDYTNDTKLPYSELPCLLKDKKNYIIICSYQLLLSPKLKQTLQTVSFKALILDEAHMVNHYSAHRTKIVFNDFWPRIPYRICLSGTPATRSVADLYTIFRRMNPTAFPDFKSFVETYTYPKWNGFGWKYEGIKNADKLSRIMRQTFYLRDEIKDVYKELPEKNWIPILLPNSLSIEHDQTKEEKEAYKKYIDTLREAISSGRQAPPPPVSHATMRRLQALNKVPDIAEYADNILAQGIPLIIFAHHTEVINKLISDLHKYNPVRISGETPPGKREEAIEAFQAGVTDLIICNYVAGGVGITLTRSSNVILAEPDYSPAVISQAVARSHRIGQVNTVNIHYFVVEHSLEERIFRILIEKATAFAKIV